MFWHYFCGAKFSQSYLFDPDSISVFVCSLSFKHPKKKIINVTGRLNGKISKKILGKNGSGYDPIFIPNNLKKTFGEMSKIKKLKIDHRYLAFKKLKKKIKIL